MPRFGAVLFDCDSTLSSLEGIEALAAEHRAEVTRLTEQAMRGEVPLEQVYGRRLELVRPTRDRVAALGREYIDTMVEDAREVVTALRAEGIDVRVVSGGLLPAVRALAAELGIDAARVAAVDVRFEESGAYAGFDEGSPLTRSDGKRDVLERWAGEMAAPVMFVGDGATDLVVKPLVNCFVAFAGVVEREAVVAAADVVVDSPSLAPILALALGDDTPTDPDHLATFEKGWSILSRTDRFRAYQSRTA